MQETACNDEMPEKGTIEISDLVDGRKHGKYDSVRVDGRMLYIETKNGRHRTYRLKCDSEGTALSWRDAIHTHIDVLSSGM